MAAPLSPSAPAAAAAAHDEDTSSLGPLRKRQISVSWKDLMHAEDDDSKSRLSGSSTRSDVASPPRPSKGDELAMQFLERRVSAVEEAMIQRSIEDRLISKLNKMLQRLDVLSLNIVLPFLRDGMNVIMEDDFSRCFANSPSVRWNWNTYLMILWLIGVVLRYCVLFPIRLACLLAGFSIFLCAFVTVSLTMKPGPRRSEWEKKLIRFLAGVFVLSWTGVIRYHGVIPAHKKNQIYVANHSSMIDMIILSQVHTFAVVGQKHPGWVGLLQDRVLQCLGCVWFDRAAAKDRQDSAERIKEHITREGSNRLLVFPEGVCVNNEYVVQFKKGVFELGATICPIAIKYNKIFVDGYWNSRRESFAMHLFNLMTSWTVVCDVWYLEPQEQLPGESPIQFASRVQRIIARRAGLQAVDWDGYMKYFRPSVRYLLLQQKVLADKIRSLAKKLPEGDQALDTSLACGSSSEGPAPAPKPEPATSPASSSARDGQSALRKRKDV